MKLPPDQPVHRAMTHRHLFLLLALTLPAAAPLRAQSGLYRVDLNQRIDGAVSIVEGRVVDQGAFWNEDRTLISTSSRIEVFRVFKGDQNVSEIQLVTPGGVIGLEAMRVEPALSVSPGEVGVFFLNPGRFGLEPFASVQGFIRYDEIRGQAWDTFSSYANIAKDLHEPIEKRLNHPARVIAPFEILRPADRSKSGAAPVISSLSPNTTSAGTGSELVISGTGFESFTGNAFVAFPAADNGGSSLISAPDSDILSWTDTQIRLRVPSGAGTGRVLVQTPGQLQGQSPSALTISFNHTTLSTSAVDGILPDLRSKNPAGGYSFSFSTNTANGGVNFATSGAATAFNRALESWRTGTGFNGLSDGGNTTGTTVDPQTDPDIIMFDNDSAQLPAGVLGRATSGYSSCDGTNWWVQGVDVVFRRDGTDGVTWNFGPGKPPFSMFDFESVAVHELGHVHQLGHVIDPGSVMHFNLTNGDELRALSPAAEVAGGLFVMDHSVRLNACGQTGMQPLFSVDVVAEELPGGYVVSPAYPNPFLNSASIRVSIPTPQRIRIDVYDVLGRQVAHLLDRVVPGPSEQDIWVGGQAWPSGLYLVVVRGEDFSASRRLVKL
jgi:IPT/TIG domain/Matrixin